MRSYSVCSFFSFKRKTAYYMRISDWSSDVCSSDLHGGALKDNKQEKCVISKYEQPEITHLSEKFYCMRNLKLPIFFKAIPVPRTTARSGSSAMCTGSLVLDWMRLSRPRSSAPPPVR